MATEKDYALIEFLLKGTESGRIKWEPTAEPAQYATSLKGKYVVTVDATTPTRGPDTYWVKLIDEQGREILRLDDEEAGGNIHALFQKVRRASMNVDAAIDDILQITDEDIPF